MKVLEEKNGYKLGINDDADVLHLPEERRYEILEPDGDRYGGSKKGITRLFEKLTQ